MENDKHLMYFEMKGKRIQLPNNISLFKFKNISKAI